MSYCRISMLLIAALLISPAAFAQPADDIDWTPRYWVSGGPAMTTLGLGLTASGGVEFGGHVLSVRANSTDPNWGSQTWDVSLQYGRIYHTGSFALTGATGMSVVGGERYSDFLGRTSGESFEPVLGFPLDGRAEWFPINQLALGVHALANVNTEQPFLGIGVSLRLGNLR